MEQMARTLAHFEKDSQWFFGNKKELKRKYPDTFVAIKDESVIEHDRDMDTLIEKIKKRGENPATVLIKFVTSSIVILRGC